MDSNQKKSVTGDSNSPNVVYRPSQPRCLSALPANIKEILAAIAKSKAQGSKELNSL